MDWNELLIFVALAGVSWLLKHLGLDLGEAEDGSGFSVSINLGSDSDWDD